MIDVFFIGNFLSKKTGTYPVSKNVSIGLQKKGFTTQLCSSINNRFLRLIDIVCCSLFVRYKIMHIDIYSGPAFIISEFSSKIAKLRNKKIIMTLHGGNLPTFFKANRNRIESVFNRADYIQTPSLSLQQFFLENDIKINYLPNPIDLEKFPFLRKNIKSKSLLWVRAFSNIYNPELAIRTLFELRKTSSDVTLTMIGPDKGNLPKIQKLIQSLDLTSVVYLIGPVKNELLYKYYQSHEVFLNTTSIESFGVAVVEAASCGIPIVSTAVGELTLLWKHEENILFANKNSKSFSEQIKRLFSSEELKLNLSNSARKKIEEFDLYKIIKDWDNIITK
jgi:glycosyltransferase involved in cell wall biosynthesis